MRKTPLRSRRQSLSRSSAPKRGKPLPKCNAKRLARVRAEQYGPEAFKDWIHKQPCVSCGKPQNAEHSEIQQSHVGKTKGAGGRAEDCAPQCRKCHAILGDIGVDTFAMLYHPGQTMKDVAAEVWQRWMDEQSEWMSA